MGEIIKDEQRLRRGRSIETAIAGVSFYVYYLTPYWDSAYCMG
jgi:hypothetical protein